MAQNTAMQDKPDYKCTQCGGDATLAYTGETVKRGKDKGDESEWETMLNRLTEIPEWAKPYIASQFQPPVHNEAGEVYVWVKAMVDGELNIPNEIVNHHWKNDINDAPLSAEKVNRAIRKNYHSELQNISWLSPAPLSGEDAGKGIGDLKQDLFDFFLWFRENGDLYIDKSIENMISIYIKTIPKP